MPDSISHKSGKPSPSVSAECGSVPFRASVASVTPSPSLSFWLVCFVRPFFPFDCSVLVDDRGWASRLPPPAASAPAPVWTTSCGGLAVSRLLRLIPVLLIPVSARLTVPSPVTSDVTSTTTHEPAAN